MVGSICVVIPMPATAGTTGVVTARRVLHVMNISCSRVVFKMYLLRVQYENGSEKEYLPYC